MKLTLENELEADIGSYSVNYEYNDYSLTTFEIICKGYNLPIFLSRKKIVSNKPNKLIHWEFDEYGVQNNEKRTYN